MKSGDLTEQVVVTAEVPAEDAEALADRLREAWGVEPIELRRPGAMFAWLECYFADPVQAELAVSALQAEDLVRAVAQRRVRVEGWSSSIREHFKGRAVGKGLYLRPTWELPESVPAGKTEIVLDPGLSFGTGDHFTTHFCLEQMDTICREHLPASCLDLGTGSGILAIAAARLGVAHALGIEHDELALEQAQKNTVLNGVDDVVELRGQDLLEQPVREAFDLVCANLYTHLLLEIAPWLVRTVMGDLLLTGILEVQVDAVADTYMQLGLEELQRDGDGEWAGLHMRARESRT